ncbi:MAG: penicillin-binding transpeptidase domain-containing protein [Candidatus Solibacter sp.]|nr:penicillin-binding transpeptidase domain-containing protein [Candidatus Solibacter sp.]
MDSASSLSGQPRGIHWSDETMLRRHAIASLLATGAWAGGIDRFFEGAHGAAVLVDRKTRRLLGAHAPASAGGSAAPPGSTLKPLVLNALLERGRLRAGDGFPCAGDLRLEGRRFDCSHPPLPAPVTVRTAIAYSCNCFVAHCASRFRTGELASLMERWGLASRTNWFGEREGAGRVWNAPSELQSLGEDGVLVTPASLAMAYCRLLPRAAPAVLAGMADAVSFGTAQRAQVSGLNVAGKTGSVRTPAGAYLAWFAGFTDGAVVTVMLQARSGGADAAPIAGRILEAHWKGRL